MNLFHTMITAYPENVYDILDDIRREDARKAQQRRKARKERARMLTKQREEQLKKAR